MLVLALGLGWAVASLTVFFRDMKHVVEITLQIGFWATPIFWNIQIMPSWIQNILKLNPMYYIVKGYRESFIYFSPFWDHPYQTLYFWVVTIILFVIGAMIFKKLKPQFADVL
jgi:ABC-type polysaccharide/polyol phosphate export permease